MSSLSRFAEPISRQVRSLRYSFKALSVNLEVRWYREQSSFFGTIFLFLRGDFMQVPYIKYLRDRVGDDLVLLVAACVVLTNEKGEVLLQQRADNQKWGLPGGLLELDETVHDCAKREVFEETGLVVELDQFIGVFNNPCMSWYQTDSARILVFAFTGHPTAGNLSVHDHESLAFGYFSKEDLPPLHAIDTVEILNAYFQQQFHLVEGRRY